MKPSVLISVALVIAAIAAFTIFRIVGGGATDTTGTKVVVAAMNIEAGSTISPADLKEVAWSEAQAPLGSFANADVLVGRVARQSMVSGEPILDAKLAPEGSRGGLAATIPFGKRAITVRVNDVIGVAGFALPGSFVDVIANGKDSADIPFSKIVLTRVKVLAVEQETDSDPTKPKVVTAVTLELTPEETERLDLARNIGTFSLALRNEMDADQAQAKGHRIDDIIKPGKTTEKSAAGTGGAKAKAEPPHGVPGVQEIRGTKVSGSDTRSSSRNGSAP